MDQLSIHTIQGFLSVPLIAPASIHELDAKEIAAALTHLAAEVAEAQEETEDAWDKETRQNKLSVYGLAWMV